MNRQVPDWALKPPPRGVAQLRCACGGMYRDYPESALAHMQVFGHRPFQRAANDTAEQGDN